MCGLFDLGVGLGLGFGLFGDFMVGQLFVGLVGLVYWSLIS